jgi:hypothetical protein
MMGYEVKPGDIAIILHPVTREGEWTGQIKTGLVFGEAESHDGMKAALEEALTMASAQAFLDTYPDAWEDFIELRGNLLQEMFPDQYAEALIETDEGYEVKDNVILLNRWTKTKGNA